MKVFQCRRKRCDLCPYEYCIDNEDYEDAMRVIAEFKQTREIEKLNNPNWAWKSWYERNREREAIRKREYYRTKKRAAR